MGDDVRRPVDQVASAFPQPMSACAQVVLDRIGRHPREQRLGRKLASRAGELRAGTMLDGDPMHPPGGGNPGCGWKIQSRPVPLGRPSWRV